MIKRENFGEPFAIHASREIDERVYARIRVIAPELTVDRGDNTYSWREHSWYQLSRITSAVIAVATIDRVVEMRVEPGQRSGTFGMSEFDFDDEEGDDSYGLAPDQRRWFFGPVGYVLRDVIALPTPVPCKGALGFWTLPADVAAKVMAQLPTEPGHVMTLAEVEAALQAGADESAAARRTQKRSPRR